MQEPEEQPSHRQNLNVIKNLCQDLQFNFIMQGIFLPRKNGQKYQNLAGKP